MSALLAARRFLSCAALLLLWPACTDYGIEPGEYSVEGAGYGTAQLAIAPAPIRSGDLEAQSELHHLESTAHGG
jgi:hypothetical protein